MTPVTGTQLAASPAPARQLGIIANPDVTAAVDEVVREVATAIGDRVIPPRAAGLFGPAVALIVTCPKGPTAAEILKQSHDRLAEHFDLLQAERAKLVAEYGEDMAVALLRGVMEIGEGVFRALGTRPIPAPARNGLARMNSAIVEHEITA